MCRIAGKGYRNLVGATKRAKQNSVHANSISVYVNSFSVYMYSFSPHVNSISLDMSSVSLDMSSISIDVCSYLPAAELFLLADDFKRARLLRQRDHTRARGHDCMRDINIIGWRQTRSIEYYWAGAFGKIYWLH